MLGLILAGVVGFVLGALVLDHAHEVRFQRRRKRSKELHDALLDAERRAPLVVDNRQVKADYAKDAALHHRRS